MYLLSKILISDVIGSHLSNVFYDTVLVGQWKCGRGSGSDFHVPHTSGAVWYSSREEEVDNWQEERNVTTGKARRRA